MDQFPCHHRTLAKAIALGDLAGAASALDLMARDGEKPCIEGVALGRAEASRIKGRPPLPELADA